MKKKIAITILLTALLTANVFGQAMLNVREYSSVFLNSRGKIDSRYLSPVSDDDYDRFAVLSGTDDIDTALEIALLSYYSQPVINIRPVQADAILPANDPKTADLKLGAAVFQEIQILRFLASNAPTDASRTSASGAVGRHEGILRFITDRGNATRAEVETFYRNGIRGLISATVDEEFNKVSFLIENIINSTGISYNGVLTRNAQNGHYTLRYESQTRNINEELSAPTLEALLVALSRSGDFSQAGINTVRTQAALIPAVALSSADIQSVKNDISNFMLNPNGNTLLELQRRYRNLALTQGERGRIASTSMYLVVDSLNVELARRMTAN